MARGWGWGGGPVNFSKGKILEGDRAFGLLKFSGPAPPRN